jgi:hypothetical protein
VLVERTERTYGIGIPSTERTTYEFGMVASATRDGVLKSWFRIGYGDQIVSEYQSILTREERAAYVLSQSEIDVSAVLTAAKSHHWPDHPGQPMPFDSVEEAREIARPFRIKVSK